jgi:hypothetical protein
MTVKYYSQFILAPFSSSGHSQSRAPFWQNESWCDPVRFEGDSALATGWACR